VENDQHEAPSECGEECGSSVDGAGEHRRKDKSQDGIECRLLGQKAAVSEPHDYQRRHEHDDATKTDLNECESRRVTA
jgi:hypothetical protein